MAVLSEAPGRTMRMAELAGATNATPSRLSHVVQRLEDRDFVERFPCPENGRVTNARLTAGGSAKMEAAAPRYAATVRRHVIDVLTPEQTAQLTAISDAILGSIAPAGPMRRATGATTGRRKGPETMMTRDIYQRCPASSHGGGWGIRTPEGVNPTRFPSVRHRPLGESSSRSATGRARDHGPESGAA
jgi:DNA-binding MarR family transcriptional regulator